MAQPYSVDADVNNQVLTQLVAQAGWKTTAVSDVTLRIQEGDAEIDSRLAALGYALPFATNPAWLKPVSVLYARYACFRDMFAGGSPSAGTAAMDNFKNEFEEKFQKLEDGWASLVDASGAVIAPANSKYGVNVAQDSSAVDNQPGQIISSFVADGDANDGLLPGDVNGSDN